MIMMLVLTRRRVLHDEVSEDDDPIMITGDDNGDNGADEEDGDHDDDDGDDDGDDKPSESNLTLKQ